MKLELLSREARTTSPIAEYSYQFNTDKQIMLGQKPLIIAFKRRSNLQSNWWTNCKSKDYYAL